MLQVRPDKKVYCIDGDGAELMHMGALSFIGSHKTDNLVHICINNAAHESVGGMPTGAAGMSYAGIAKACGYDLVHLPHRLRRNLKKHWRRCMDLTEPHIWRFLSACSQERISEDLRRARDRTELILWNIRRSDR